MSITGTVTNDQVSLPHGVHLPDGTLVRVETVHGTSSGAWPAGYFERTAGALAGEPFPRVEDDREEIREAW